MSVSFGYLANIWPLPVVFSGYAEKTQKISYEPRFQDRCDYFPVFASKYIANISCGHGWLPIRCCLFIYCDDDDLDLGTEFIIIGLKVKALRSSNKVYQYDFLNMLIFTHFSDWRNYCTAWVDFYANLLFYLWNYYILEVENAADPWWWLGGCVCNYFLESIVLWYCLIIFLQFRAGTLTFFR